MINGPLGHELQQIRIKNKIMIAIARKMGVKKKELSKKERLRNFLYTKHEKKMDDSIS